MDSQTNDEIRTDVVSLDQLDDVDSGPIEERGALPRSRAVVRRTSIAFLIDACPSCDGALDMIDANEESVAKQCHDCETMYIKNR
jgi:hypothetical protein